MMGYICFDVAISANIAHIKMKRGDEFNTMIPEFWTELPEILHDIDDHAKARVIVLSSTGKHFSAGMDISRAKARKAPDPGATDKQDRARVSANFRRAMLDIQGSFNAIERIQIPVLAAVQGGCIGGALDMVSACDIRYATQDAFFVIQEINIGLVADAGTFPRFCRLVPDGWVRELAYTGDRLSGQKAKELGFANEIFPTQAEMLDHVMKVAQKIAEKSPLAMSGSKAMINYARDHSIADGLDYVSTWNAGMCNREGDLAAAMSARVQKRTPEFDDLLPFKKLWE